MNLRTGERTLVQRNPGLAGFVADDDFTIRFAFDYTPDGGAVLLRIPEGATHATLVDTRSWEEFLTVGPLDAMTSYPVGFDKDATVLYAVDSRDRDTSALVAIDIATGDKTLLAEHDKADLDAILVHPTEKTIQAVGFTYARREWTILDDTIKPDLDYLDDGRGRRVAGDQHARWTTRSGQWRSCSTTDRCGTTGTTATPDGRITCSAAVTTSTATRW